MSETTSLLSKTSPTNWKKIIAIVIVVVLLLGGIFLMTTIGWVDDFKGKSWPVIVGLFLVYGGVYGIRRIIFKM